MSFAIGSHTIEGDLVLAPMDGYSDSPFRSICRQFGSSFSISEFISTSGSSTRKVKKNPHIFFAEIERPFGFQLSGENPQKMLYHAQQLLLLKPDFFDVNIGCPDRQIVSHGAGAALMLKPELVSEIISLLSCNLPVPVSAKIRLGWDEKHKNYLEISKIIEQSGASFLAVHARTRAQIYSGLSDWNAIREIKNAIQIPVIGNGDVHDINDIEKMKKHTECDLVMIGRSAVGNPWIFSRRSKISVTTEEIIRTMLKHLYQSINLYGESGGIRIFRKHMRAYLSTPQCAHIDQSQLIQSTSADYISNTLSRMF